MRDAELIALLAHATCAGSTVAHADNSHRRRRRCRSSTTSSGADAQATTRAAAHTPQRKRSSRTKSEREDDDDDGDATAAVTSSSSSLPPVQHTSINWCTVAALLYATTRQLHTPARVRALYMQLLTSDAYKQDEAALRRDAVARAAAVVATTTSATPSSPQDDDEHDNKHSDKDDDDDDDYMQPRPLSTLTELSYMAHSAAAATALPPPPSSPLPARTHTTHTDDGSTRTVTAVSKSSVKTEDDKTQTTTTTTTRRRGTSDDGAEDDDDDDDEDEDEVQAWLRRLSPALRAHARRLWCEVALRHEVLSALLQQFFCVEGADVFFAPVPANTIMEYNGVRLASYHSVVRVPMSLMAVKKCISDSRRDYHALTSMAALAQQQQRRQQRLLQQQQQQQQRRQEGDGGGAAESMADSVTDDGNSSVGSDVYDAQSAVRIDNSNNNNGIDTRAVCATGSSSSSSTVVPLSRSSHMERIVTLAELHRAVWLITANCVMFNAPETNYPYTARRFASACTRVLLDYCDKQLLS